MVGISPMPWRGVALSSALLDGVTPFFAGYRPIVAIVALGPRLLLRLILFGRLRTFLALLTASATLWLYLAVALGALKQRPRGFALVGGLAGLAFTLFAFYGSGLEANLWSLALLAAGIVMFAIMRMRHGASPARAAAPAGPRE